MTNRRRCMERKLHVWEICRIFQLKQVNKFKDRIELFQIIAIRKLNAYLFDYYCNFMCTFETIQDFFLTYKLFF